MNKLIKNYVINIEYKGTTFLSFQLLMSYTDEMNQKRVHIYRQKVKSICYSVIITRSMNFKLQRANSNEHHHHHHGLSEGSKREERIENADREVSSSSEYRRELEDARVAA